MKRRISLALTSLQIPDRPAEKPMMMASSACSSAESLLPVPESPFINRQLFDAATVSQLRAACALVVSGIDVPEEYLEYTKALDKKAKDDEKRRPKARMSRLPTFTYEESPVSPRRYTFAPEMSTKQPVPVRSDHRGSRIVAHQIYKQVLDAPIASRRTSRQILKEQAPAPEQPVVEMPKLAPCEELASPLSPLTDDEYRDQYVRNYEQQQRTPRLVLSTESIQQEHRPASRASRITDSLKKYVKPSSVAATGRNSRCESRQSQNQSRSSSRNGQQRPGSALGWKSWGRRRESSENHPQISRVDSAFSSSRGSNARQTEEEDKAVQLNRALPPLPSLETWAAPPEPPTHIANVMQPAKREAGRASMQLAASSPGQRSIDDSSSTNTNRPSIASSSVSTQPTSATTESVGREPTPDLQQRPHRPALRQQQSCANMMTSYSLVPQHSGPAVQEPTRASKASLLRSQSVDCLNRFSEASLTALPVVKTERKSNGLAASLRKILRGWTKNEQASKGEVVDQRLDGKGTGNDGSRTPNWMRSMEAQGVKRGVIVPQFGTLTPVVRG